MRFVQPLLMLLFLLIGGCSTLPFTEESRVDFRGVNPGSVTAKFDCEVGRRFEALESVVFSFFGKEMTGMGYISIDDRDGSYALTCMNPAGIKLFEFCGMGDEVETLFMPPQLEKVEEDFAESVACDIRRIYFGWLPSEDAVLNHKKDQVVFTARTDNEKVKYTYAGPQGVLVRKQCFDGWKTTCNIRYFEYKNSGGKLYPHGIMLHNKKYHYKLILRVKQIYPMRDNE